jgi:hypothetical protein
VIATGTPEEIAGSGTYTGHFLERMLDENITPYAKELVEDIANRYFFLLFSTFFSNC